jgi:hypothetical protein
MICCEPLTQIRISEPVTTREPFGHMSQYGAVEQPPKVSDFRGAVRRAERFGERC